MHLRHQIAFHIFMFQRNIWSITQWPNKKNVNTDSRFSWIHCNILVEMIVRYFFFFLRRSLWPIHKTLILNWEYRSQMKMRKINKKKIHHQFSKASNWVYPDNADFVYDHTFFFSIYLFLTHAIQFSKRLNCAGVMGFYSLKTNFAWILSIWCE